LHTITVLFFVVDREITRLADHFPTAGSTSYVLICVDARVASNSTHQQFASILPHSLIANMSPEGVTDAEKLEREKLKEQ